MRNVQLSQNKLVHFKNSIWKHAWNGQRNLFCKGHKLDAENVDEIDRKFSIYL